MKNAIKKIFHSKFWFVLPIFSVFIENNFLAVIFWIIVLFTISIAGSVQCNDKNKITN